MVKAHHRAQLPVLQIEARDRERVVRAAVLGGEIWLGNGIVDIQYVFQCSDRAAKDEGCCRMHPVLCDTVPAGLFQVP
eukprot:2128894-Lingulodinium_polyedra.AAC.1